MRVTRISVLAVMALVAGLLGSPPASAVDPAGAVGLFYYGPAYPVTLEPIARTANGLVWREPDSPEFWMLERDNYRHPTRLGGVPQSAGDLMSRYDAAAHTFWFYEMGAFPGGEQTTVIPTDLTYLASTSTGYLAQRGTGPYELVSVDWLHQTAPVVFGTTTISQSSLKTGPLGALATGDVPGQYVYFPYATPGSGQVLQTPAGSACTLTSVRLYCTWSSGSTNHLTRLPLDGGAGDQIDVAASSIVEVSTGIAFTSVNGDTTTLMSWGLTDAAPRTVLGGDFTMTSRIAAATDTPSTVLVSHPGPDQNGIYAVSLDGGSPTLQVESTTRPQRQATDVAVSPGMVAWADNTGFGGSVWEDDVQGVTLLSGQRIGESDTGGTLSTAGTRLTYTTGPSALGPSVLDDSTSPRGSAPPKLNDSGIVSQLSGERVLIRSRIAGADGVTEPWTLKDLRTGRTTALPDAVSYHLSGERLARLDADGSVWVLDLRTGASPVQLRAPSADLTDGRVLIAGDIVGWQVTSSAGSSSATEMMTRNLRTMAPAAPVTGLTRFMDLSTGYAVGSTCQTSDYCRTAAVSLADGSATTFDPAPRSANHFAAVDGNTLAFVSVYGMASLFSLPAYADTPRLLALPRPTATGSTTQPWTAHVIASRVLDSCQIEIRDAAHTFVRALSCLDTHASATVTWDGKMADGSVVPDGAYTWRIIGAAGGIPLTDYDGSTTALSGSMTLLPSVTVKSPAPNAVTVSQTGNVRATFNQPVAGVSSATFVLKSPAGTTVPATVSYDPISQTATLHPAAALGADVRYTATVTGGATAIRDTANRPASSTSWSFLTGPAPRQIAYSPHNYTGPPLNTNITARFDEPVQGVSATTFLLDDSSTSSWQRVSATVTYDPTTLTATLNPDADLIPHDHYVVTLVGSPTDIRDRVGNPLAYQSWDLYAGPGPVIAARTPAVNATGAQINGNINVTFNEPLMASGVNKYTVMLTSPAGTKLPALITYNPTNRTITMNPIATLGRNVRYRVILQGGGGGILDPFYNEMNTTWWYFTTGTK